jgi:hypothetical protein
LSVGLPKPTFTTSEKTKIFRSLLIGLFVLLFLIFVYPGTEKLRRKKDPQKIQTSETNEFKKTSFKVKNEIYTAQVVTSTYTVDGILHINPIQECPDLMVITTEYNRNHEQLRKELEKLDGIGRVDLHPHLIIIHRVCFTTEDGAQVWKWLRVFESIELVLKR